MHLPRYETANYYIPPTVRCGRHKLPRFPRKTRTCRAEQFSFPSVSGYNRLVLEPEKFFRFRLRGWFVSLVAVQGDLPVITAESRHCFLDYGLSPS